MGNYLTVTDQRAAWYQYVNDPKMIIILVIDDNKKIGIELLNGYWNRQKQPAVAIACSDDHGLRIFPGSAWFSIEKGGKN